MFRNFKFSHNDFTILMEGNINEIFLGLETNNEYSDSEVSPSQQSLSSKYFQDHRSEFRFEFRVGGNIDINWTTLELIKKEEMGSEYSNKKNSKKSKIDRRNTSSHHMSRRNDSMYRTNHPPDDIEHSLICFDKNNNIIGVAVEIQVLDFLQQRIVHFWVKEGYFVRSFPTILRERDKTKKITLKIEKENSKPKGKNVQNRKERDMTQTYLSLSSFMKKQDDVQREMRPEQLAFLCQTTHIFSTYFEDADEFIRKIRGTNLEKENYNYKSIPPLSEYPTLSGGKIIDSGLLGRYRFELHSHSEKSKSIVVGAHTHVQYVHMMYLFAPRESKPSIVVLAQKLTKQKHYVLMLHTADGVNNIGVDRQLRYATYFRKKALEVLHDYLQVPVLLEYPNNHPALTDSEMSEFGYIGAFRFEIHENCQVDFDVLPKSNRKSSLLNNAQSAKQNISVQQDYSQMEYIFVCYLYEGHSVEPLLSFAFEKLHPSYLPSLQMRDEKQIFEIGFDPNLYDIGVFRDRCITLAHLYLHNFNKENVQLPSSKDNRYIWTQFFTNNLQSGSMSKEKPESAEQTYINLLNSTENPSEVLHQEIEKIMMKRKDTQEKIEHYIRLDRFYFSSLFLLSISTIILSGTYLFMVDQWPILGGYIPHLRWGVLLYCGIQIFRLYQSSRHFFFQYRIRFFQQDPVGIWNAQVFPALFMILSLCVPISLLFFAEKNIHALSEFWVLVVLISYFVRSFRLIRQSLPSVICSEVRWWGTPIERVQLLKELRLKHVNQKEKDTKSKSKNSITQ